MKNSKISPPFSQLHYNTSWQRLKDTFRRVGSIAHVDILKGSDGRSRGCAVVTFDHPDDAQKAIGEFFELIPLVEFVGY